VLGWALPRPAGPTCQGCGRGGHLLFVRYKCAGAPAVVELDHQRAGRPVVVWELRPGAPTRHRRPARRGLVV